MPDSWANWKDTWFDLGKLYGLKHMDTDMSSAQEIAKFAAEKSNDAPAGSFAAMQMRAIGPNRYELLNGQRRQIGKDGLPIILTIE
jgi:hypothetical protein